MCTELSLCICDTKTSGTQHIISTELSVGETKDHGKQETQENYSHFHVEATSLPCGFLLRSDQNIAKA